MSKKEIKLPGDFLKMDIFDIAAWMVKTFAEESAKYESLVITYRNPRNRIEVKCDSITTTAKDIIRSYGNQGLDLLRRRG